MGCGEVKACREHVKSMSNDQAEDSRVSKEASSA